MKRMLGTWGILSCCWAMAFVPVVAAQEKETPAVSKADILAGVPGNAWAVLCVRNVGELDHKLMKLAQQLNVPPMSPLSMAKGMLGMIEGVDDNGGVAMVLMPVPNIMDPSQGMAILVPCQDFTALTSMMEPEDVGEGVSRVLLAGEESYIAPHGAFAVLGPSPAPLKAVLAAKDSPNFGKGMTKHQLERFAGDDLTLWINMEGLTADPGVQGMLTSLAMMSGGSFKTEELKDIQNLAMTVRLEQSGLRLGFYAGMKEDTEQAKTIASGPTGSKTLLTGLPQDDFVVAFGSEASKEQAAKSAKDFAGMLNNPMVAMQLQADPEKLKRLSDIVVGMVGGMRHLAFSISGLPAGPDGLIGLAKVVTVEGDAPAKCAQVAEIIQLISSGLVQGEQAGEVEEAMSMIKYTPAAETLGGVKVDHLAINIDQMEEVAEEDFAKVKKVVGKEGILFRMAAVDDKRIAATFGGGKERMQKVIELIKSGGAPLSADEGIKRVAATLPRQRSVEGYLAVDRLIATIITIAKAIDQAEGAPPAFPSINAPLALVGGPVGKGGYQVDVSLPMEFIVAAKDYAASAFGMGMGGPGGSAGPGEPEKPDTGTGG